MGKRGRVPLCAQPEAPSRQWGMGFLGFGCQRVHRSSPDAFPAQHRMSSKHLHAVQPVLSGHGTTPGGGGIKHTI